MLWRAALAGFVGAIAAHAVIGCASYGYGSYLGWRRRRRLRYFINRQRAFLQGPITAVDVAARLDHRFAVRDEDPYSI